MLGEGGGLVQRRLASTRPLGIWYFVIEHPVGFCTEALGCIIGLYCASPLYLSSYNQSTEASSVYLSSCLSLFSYKHSNPFLSKNTPTYKKRIKKIRVHLEPMRSFRVRFIVK
ncbi:hypothetical protein KP509_13G066000 [Ceratopteris richardii]|uniref:Uncharacterized protein n=1 Tax=Ceratopteris richardii TaxID=49495 RepID=A0A8T2TJP7_CERRI|nr:hypothetical protein KP509_13G066000 [Ceratopteris richardii]